MQNKTWNKFPGTLAWEVQEHFSDAASTVSYNNALPLTQVASQQADQRFQHNTIICSEQRLNMPKLFHLGVNS